PPLAGFWSKDEVVGAAFTNGYPILWAVGVFTGGLTAFYVTRALWLTFHGEPRDRHLYDHAHESPRLMTAPLVVLGVGSVLAGFVGFPPEDGFLHRFLPEALYPHGHEVHQPQLAVIAGLAATSVFAGLIGIFIGLSMYARRRPDPAAVRRAAGPVHRVLENKYYVDELLDRRFVDLSKAFAGASWAFDAHIVDGIVNRIGWAFGLAGSGLRRLQTGLVGNYALSIVAGVLAIIVLYGGYATGVLRR
ncbi:MAG: NADH-quinone oxidoreductase subunit L, partial [Chloroflexi bacterium]|nr:NADH-quinone oxidoreductase subunit L [Chloroflexota bacterium]